MGIINSDFTNGLTGWMTSSLSCGSWLQSVAPEPPFVHIKAQACTIWIQQDFIIDNPVLKFDWSYFEQYSYEGCDAYAYWSLTRISDGAVLKSGNLTGSECGASSGTVTEDVSAYIGTNARIRFTLVPSGQRYSFQAELLIGNVKVYSPTCPSAPKYSGNTITLKATPKDGIGPYYVVFRKNGVTIDPSRLGGLSNPILSAPENILITRIYTLDDLDISSALLGTINFSVYIEDSCPTGAKSCTDTCTITIGCVAPVCNFQVT